jgi:hypothetical protein
MSLTGTANYPGKVGQSFKSWFPVSTNRLILFQFDSHRNRFSTSEAQRGNASLQ